MKVNFHLGLLDVSGEEREAHASGAVSPKACEASSEVAGESVYARFRAPLCSPASTFSTELIFLDNGKQDQTIGNEPYQIISWRFFAQPSHEAQDETI